MANAHFQKNFRQHTNPYTNDVPLIIPILRFPPLLSFLMVYPCIELGIEKSGRSEKNKISACLISEAGAVVFIIFGYAL
jgi:hypothetical protein